MRALKLFLAVALAFFAADGVPSRADARDDPAISGMVAVFEIEVDGMELAPSVVGNLTAYLSSRMTAVGEYKTVAATSIEKALVEKKRESHADACDKTCQIELAQKISADKALHSKIRKVGNICYLTLDLYDLESEVMEKSVEVEAASCTEPQLKKAVAAAVLKLGGTDAGQASVQGDGRSGGSGAVRLSPPPEVSEGGSAGADGVTWIRIPGGTFQMGSDDSDSYDWEKPVHTVTVPTFEIAKTEVTVEEYGKCVAAGVCSAPSSDNEYCNWGKSGRENYPVNCVDWNQATAYAKWVGGRLPTEAEWEYAARSGGRDQKYPWGNQTATCLYAVMYDGSVSGCGRDSTWAVCSKPAGNTMQGLCDMSGNVWEWVSDWYESYDSGSVTNPTGPSTGSTRVFRGGAFDYDARFVRAAVRDGFDPDGRDDYLGFRLARSVR